MWRKIAIHILYRLVLALPDVLLKDKNLRRRNKAKDLLFNLEQSHFDSTAEDSTVVTPQASQLILNLEKPFQDDSIKVK